MIKKIMAVSLVAIMLLAFTSCTKGTDNSVVIMSSSEEFRNEIFSKELKEKFPDYDITVQYLPTGKSAAKIKAEEKSTDTDILVGLETAYLEQLNQNLADVSFFDTSEFMDELLPAHKKYVPWERYSGCIVINTKLLKEKGLQKPENYQDLLKPEYKDLISMPSPKASGTGFMFLRNLINTMGEDAAFAYFDELAKNITQFATSGSGPVNALVQGEVAIGLGMTFQAVNEINKGMDFEILYFEEGAPFTTTGNAIIEGKQNKPAVKEVFEYLTNELNKKDKAEFSPEKIFKEQEIKIENYPIDIKYADMTGIQDIAEKERLLDKWKH